MGRKKTIERLTENGPLVHFQSDVEGQFRVQFALTSTQIIGMFAAPVVLIPAQGDGKAIVVDNVTFKMMRTATPFTGGGNVRVRYTGAASGVCADIAASVVSTGRAGVEYANVRGVEAAMTPLQNTAIEISNLTRAFAAGRGSAEVIIDFHIVE